VGSRKTCGISESRSTSRRSISSATSSACLVGADRVVERHPGRDDEMVRPEVHAAQVEQRVDAPGIFDLGPYHR
jgi:hypothetical protein